MNRVVEILMKRDGLSQAEATQLVADTREELLVCATDGATGMDADEIIMNNLGLESDYLFDILY